MPLLIFIVAGALRVSTATRGLPTRPRPQRGTLGEAALLLLFAYAGFENTAAPAGEFKNPKRDVPFALIAQIVIVTLIYTLVQLVGLGTLPERRRVADAARRRGRGCSSAPWGGWLMTFGAAVSILGTNSNTVLAGPRYLYALAADGFGPRRPRVRPPALPHAWIVAIVLQTAIALPLALTGTFVGAGRAVGRRAPGDVHRHGGGRARAAPQDAGDPRTIRLPGGPAIPIAALAVCVVFLSSATARNLVAGAIALAVGVVIYAAGRRGERTDSAPRI